MVRAVTVIRQRCRACGTPNALHRDELELCVPCQIEDHYYDLTHWQARIWDELHEEEHEEAADYMRADLAQLHAIRDAHR